MTASLPIDHISVVMQRRHELRQARLAYLAERLQDPAYKADLEASFPAIHPNREPNSCEVLVQLKLPKEKVGSIIIPGMSKVDEKFNTRIGKVIAIGPEAFRSRDTLEPWPTGAQCELGDFVVLPEHHYGDKRFERVPGSNDPVLCVMIDDTRITAFVRDPLDDIATINWAQALNQ